MNASAQNDHSLCSYCGVNTDLLQFENDHQSYVSVRRCIAQDSFSLSHLLHASSLGNFNLLGRHSATFQYVQLQSFHTNSGQRREESKVEETLEALKDSIKETTASAADAAEAKVVKAVEAKAPVADQPTALTQVAVPAKKSLRERFVAEVKHYYHGFRLLFIDFRVCARLIWQVLNGRPLMRREQKQLVRTTADLFRLVPFLVIVLVPFAELLLPVLLKLFPDMLPSTFKEEDRELEKRRKRLKMKLEMAKFLQDTIEETALQRKGATGESVHDFLKFMEKIRTSGVQTSNEEILKYSKLFEDEITLDNLSFAQLRALCRLVELPTVGTSYVLRFQLEMKLRQLEADDRMIQKEGVDSLAVWELQEACRARAMRSFGVSEQRLKSQISQWLDLHLNHKIPASLLLLSRTLYLPENLSPSDQLKATISVLPDTTTEEAKVKILEVSGDRVDNKSKLEVIRMEEEIIQREKEELRKEEEAEKKLLKVKEAVATATPLESAAQPSHVTSPVEELTDKAPILAETEAEKIEHIDTEDLSKIEDLLEHVAASKRELRVEVEELKALKEDITEYQENLEGVKGVVQSSGGTLSSMTESKAAQRLSRKVNKMIAQMDEVVTDLTSRKEALIGDINAKKGTVAARSATADGEDVTRKQILEEISEEQHTLITINELLESIQKLKKVSDSKKFEIIARVLDEDKDGVIDFTDAMKVIELLGKENIKLSAEQMVEIMSVLRKEKEILEAEKLLRKQQQQQQQPNTVTEPSPKTDSKSM